MPDYLDHITARRRLGILANLWFATGYRMSARDLRELVGRRQGLVASLDTIRADCAWLADTGLVEWDGVNEQATLTDRGSDVVLGQTRVPGVARPQPGERFDGPR